MILSGADLRLRYRPVVSLCVLRRPDSALGGRATSHPVQRLMEVEELDGGARRMENIVLSHPRVGEEVHEAKKTEQSEQAGALEPSCWVWRVQRCFLTTKPNFCEGVVVFLAALIEPSSPTSSLCT